MLLQFLFAPVFGVFVQIDVLHLPVNLEDGVGAKLQPLLLPLAEGAVGFITQLVLKCLRK